MNSQLSSVIGKVYELRSSLEERQSKAAELKLVLLRGEISILERSRRSHEFVAFANAAADYSCTNPKSDGQALRMVTLRASLSRTLL